MTIDFDNHELVEAYLNNQLSAEEKLRFEQNLDNDPEFSEFVSLYKDVDSAISETDVMDLRNSLNAIHDEVSEDWIEEAPMIITDSFEQEIFDALGEKDVMDLRASLNEIHELNHEEIVPSDELAKVESMDMKELLSLVDGDDADFGDPLLNEEIDMAIAETDVMDLRNQLGAIAEDVKAKAKPTKTKRIPLYKRMSKLSVAASIALFISMGVTSWIAFDDFGMSPEKVFNRTYDPITAAAPSRGGQVEGWKEVKRQGLELYRDGNHLRAIDQFKDLFIKFPDTRKQMDVHLLIAGGYLETDQITKAIAEFKIVFEDQETMLRDEAEWYLAGCYLREKDLDRAIKIYQQIARNTDNERYEDSRELLKKLKK